MRKYWIGILCSYALVSSVALAQSEVCCFLAKPGKESIDVRALGLSSKECIPGKVMESYRICASQSDPENHCANTPTKNICAACQYFWDEGKCLAEMPKAKKGENKLEVLKKQKIKGPMIPNPDASGSEAPVPVIAPDDKAPQEAPEPIAPPPDNSINE